MPSQTVAFVARQLAACSVLQGCVAGALPPIAWSLWLLAGVTRRRTFSLTGGTVF